MQQHEVISPGLILLLKLHSVNQKEIQNKLSQGLNSSIKLSYQISLSMNKTIQLISTEKTYPGV